MTINGLLRIVFRRWRAGLLVFGATATIGALLATRIPLSYSAETILERRHADLSPAVREKAYDMTRLTSETEQTVTLLKSRHLLNLWRESIHGPGTSAKEQEKQVNELRDALSVRPVSFTDLFIIKVKATSPAVAQQRTDSLTSLYQKWNLEHSLGQARDSLDLLDRRMEAHRSWLEDSRQKLYATKKQGDMDLAGSSVVQSLEADILAREQLLQTLLTEKEQWQRRLDGDPAIQIRVVTPPTVSSDPEYSRVNLLGLVLAVSLLLAFAALVLMEKMDASVRRVGDIHAATNSSLPVITVNRWSPTEPAWERDHGEFRSLLNHIRSHLMDRGTVTVQVVSAFQGDGKTIVARHITELLNLSGTPARLFDHSENQDRAQETIAVRVVDVDTQVGDVLWSQLDQRADITCAVLSAGRTTRDLVRALEDRFSKSDRHRLFFILNFYQDPLPAWFQR